MYRFRRSASLNVLELAAALSVAAYAGDARPRITLALKGESAERALALLFQQAGAGYRLEAAEVHGAVTANIKDLPLEAALRIVLRQVQPPLAFHEQAGTWILALAPAPATRAPAPAPEAHAPPYVPPPVVPVAPAEPPASKPAPPALEPLNAQLIRFCKSKMGQQVGDGECASLVIAGLRTVGASLRWPDFPSLGDYVWGTPVCLVEVTGGRPSFRAAAAGEAGKIHPGDVIQFRSVVFAGRIPNGTYSQTFPHHSAVVETVSEDGKSCRLLEQNVQGRRTVGESTLYLPDLQQGSLRVYRPVPAQAPR
jgi:hypothetical protein